MGRNCDNAGGGSAGYTKLGRAEREGAATRRLPVGRTNRQYRERRQSLYVQNKEAPSGDERGQYRERRQRLYIAGGTQWRGPVTIQKAVAQAIQNSAAPRGEDPLVATTILGVEADAIRRNKEARLERNRDNRERRQRLYKTRRRPVERTRKHTESGGRGYTKQGGTHGEHPGQYRRRGHGLNEIWRRPSVSIRD